MEDLMVRYDQTVRSSKNRIVQFRYGEDSIDPCKVEIQSLPLVSMSVQDIYDRFALTADSESVVSAIMTKKAFAKHKKADEQEQLRLHHEKYVHLMLDARKLLAENGMGDKVRAPVAFTALTDNVVGQFGISGKSQTDLTLVDAYTMLLDTMSELKRIPFAAPTDMFQVLYWYHLAPKQMVIVRRLGRRAFTVLLELIVLSYKRAIVNPGEMVGVIAGQSIGEPTTQMTLNTFHFAGISSKSNVTRGVPRIEEILALSATLKNPSLTVYLTHDDELDREKAHTLMTVLEHTKLRQLVSSVKICYDATDNQTAITEDADMIKQFKQFESLMSKCAGTEQDAEANGSNWVLRMVMDPRKMLDKNITMDDVHFALTNTYSSQRITCIYSDYNQDQLVFRIRPHNLMSDPESGGKTNDATDHIHLLTTFRDNMLDNVVLRGIKHIEKATIRSVVGALRHEAGAYVSKDIWVVDTVGCNLLDVLAMDNIDPYRTISNDINEVHDVLGVEAAKQTIYAEIDDVMSFGGGYVDYHHMTLLADRMTFGTKLVAVRRSGINGDDTGPLAKASFEETPTMFMNAGVFGELDLMTGISANIMCGQEGTYGTSSFKVLLDLPQMAKVQPVAIAVATNATVDTDMLHKGKPGCLPTDLTVDTNVGNVLAQDMGQLDDAYDPFE